MFGILSYPGHIGNLLFPMSHMVEIRAAPGVRLRGLGLFLEYVLGILWHVQSQGIERCFDFVFFFCHLGY